MSMKFIEDYEWIIVDGDVVMVGIMVYVVEQLGDVVFVELLDVGKIVFKGDEFVVVEFVKVVFEVYVLVDGEIVEVNGELEDELVKVNEELIVGGWFVKFKLFDVFQLEGLMDEVVYKVYIV